MQSLNVRGMYGKEGTKDRENRGGRNKVYKVINRYILEFVRAMRSGKFVCVCVYFLFKLIRLYRTSLQLHYRPPGGAHLPS